MRNRMMKILAAAIACALLVTALLAFTSCGDDADKNTIHIGASGPLTGNAASYGISVQKGAALAVEMINAAGGLNGLTFRLTMLDDQATSTQASINYDTLLDQGIHVSIGVLPIAVCSISVFSPVRLYHSLPSAGEKPLRPLERSYIPEN